MNVFKHPIRPQFVRNIFSYMTRYRNQIFIICIDDDLSEYQLMGIVDDIALLVDMNIRIALVTNSTVTNYEQVKSNERVAGVIKSNRVAQLRMKSFDMASRIVARLSQNNKIAVMGNWTSAQGYGVIEGIDYGHAGTVQKFETSVLQTLLEDMIIPVLPALGWSRTGKEYILNAYQFALSLFEALQAKKLCFVHGEDFSSQMHALHIPQTENIDCNEAGEIVRLSLRGVSDLLQHNKQAHNTLAVPTTYPMLLSHATQSLRKHNERIHFLSGLKDGAILIEIFDNLGAGTMLYTDEFESIRPMTPSDIETVYRIMLPLIERKILLPRTLHDIKQDVNSYFVFSVDDLIQGAVGLYHFNKSDAEIGALAVAHGYEQLGLGKKLVHFAIKTARDRSYTRLFALTTKTGDWFEQLGFMQGSVAMLPRARQEQYVTQARNSRVYYYQL